MHCLERKEKLGYIIRKFFELFGAESSLVVEGTSPVRSWLKKTAISFGKLYWALSDWKTEKLTMTCWFPFPGGNTSEMLVFISIGRILLCSVPWIVSHSSILVIGVVSGVLE